VIEILSLLFGAAALLLAIYSRHKQAESEERQEELVEKQRRMEERLEKKEELHELADDLDEIIDWLTELEDSLSSLPPTPTPSKQWQEPDKIWWDRLVQIGKDSLAFKYQTGEFPPFSLDVYDYRKSDEKWPFEGPEEAVEAFNDLNRMPSITVTLEQGDELYSDEPEFSNLDRVLEGAGKYKYRIPSLEDDKRELLDEFSEGILEEIDSNIDTITLNVFRQALDAPSKIELDLEKVDSVEHFAATICFNALVYDGLNEDIEELSSKIAELEDVRKRVRQTGYS